MEQLVNFMQNTKVYQSNKNASLFQNQESLKLF